MIYSYSLFGFSMSVLLVGFLTLIKRREEVGTRFFIFCADVFGWGILISFWISQQFSESTSLWIIRTSHMFSTTIPVAWLHFVRVFSGQKEPHKFFYKILYLAAALMSLSCLTPYFISGTHSILGLKYYPSPGPVYHFFTLYFFILVPYAFWSLVLAVKQSSGTMRRQFQYLIAAVVVAFAAGSSTFLPVYNIATPLYLIPAMLLFPFLMGIALIKYGLFDVQQIADSFQREKITALGIMAASLNHEMRNPLYIAKGKIEGYRDGVETSRLVLAEKEKKADEVIVSVAHQLERTLDIMQRFSDFARPQNMSKKEKIIFKELFQDVSELVSYEIQRKKITVKVDIDPKLTIQAHKRQMEEVLVNLMINASQALGNSGGEIHIKASGPNHKIAIEISDNGAGISEENLTRIFDPFFTTKESGKGTGLGLYITKQLVERNGGKISVKSKPGKGTCFRLEFKR